MALGNTQAFQPFVRPEPVTQGRGIYRSTRKVRGRWAYYAVTSAGVVLDPMRPRHYETDADVVMALATRLDREDPVLRLVSAAMPGAPASSRPWFWMHGLRPLLPSPDRSPRPSASGRSRG